MWPRILVSVVITSMLSSTPVKAYTNGAAHSSCQTLSVPATNHGTAGALPSPYTLIVQHTTTYTDNKQIDVIIKGAKISGLILQARKVRSTQWQPVGRFSIPTMASRICAMACVEEADTITHAASFFELLDVITTWVAPAGDQGTIEFRATVISSDNKYYSNLVSANLTYVQPAITTTTTTTPATNTPTTSFRPNSAPSAHAAVGLVTLASFLVGFIVTK